MNNLKLTLACGRYDRTQPLIDGRVPEGVDLTSLPLNPGKRFFACSITANSTFPRCRCRPTRSSVRKATPALSPFRSFPRASFVIRRSICARISIEKPQELAGKRVGVGDYQMFRGGMGARFSHARVWRAAQDVTWVSGRPVRAIKPPEGVRIEPLPAGTTLEAMLERGEIDALATVVIPEGLGKTMRRLFPDFRKVETEYFRQTGIFPIMHTFVLKRQLYEQNPWLAVSFYRAFCKARDLAYHITYDTNALTVSLPWIIDEVEQTHKIFGPQIWDYSIDGSRPTLEALVTYLDEQQLTRRKMSVDELFVPNIGPGLADYLRATGED